MKSKLFWMWLNFGMNRKWISGPVCSTHECFDQTDEELKEWDEGGDPCIVAIRVW
jgi:hypothetical protein